MVVSSAVRSASGRAGGTGCSADRTCCQYAVDMSAILPATGDGHPARPAYAGPVPSLLELVRSHTDLDEAAVGVLQLLMADWQIIAALSFAALVLWLPDRGGEGFWAAAQMRPTTGPTAYVDD